MTRDPLDDAMSDPLLSELLAVLAGPASDDELAAEQAALTMFTGVSANRPQTRRRRAGPARTFRLSGRLAAAGTVAALVGGFAAAAYASVLPPGLQHVAHQILGFAGVPNPPGKHGSQPPGGPGGSGGGHATQGRANSASPSSGSGTSAQRAHRTRSPSPRPSSPLPRPSSPSPGPGSPAPSSSPSPTASPLPAGRLALTASQRQITAGGSVSFTAVLTSRRQPVPGSALSLLARRAATPTWREITQAVTNSAGEASFTWPGLTVNTSFRVTAAGGTESNVVSVVVIPPVHLSVIPASAHRPDVLVVSCPLAQRGNGAELEELTASGQWKPLRLHRLSKARQTRFEVTPRKVSATYQVVLLATALHGQSASSRVTIAPR